MVAELFANNFTTTLNGTINNSVTTLVLNASVPTSLRAAGQWRLLVESELMLVTNVNVDNVTLTVTRGTEGTTAASHTSGVNCSHVLTAGAMGNLPTGGSISSGLCASLPAAGVAGRLYQCTDSPLQFLDNGSTWDAISYGNFIPNANIPVPGSFTWRNQGTATAVTTYGGLFIGGTTYFNGVSVFDVPWATNKTLIMYGCMMPTDRTQTNGWVGGISLMKPGVNDSAIVLGSYNQGPPVPNRAFFLHIGTGYTNFQLANWGVPAWGDYIWYKVADNGSNTSFSVSRNGLTWELLDNTGNTYGNTWGAGVPPDRIGIATSSPTWHVLSWKVF